MQGAFIALIGYAIVTWLIAALVIDYQHYDFIASGIRLKSGLIDYYIFFLVFLFGVQTPEDAMKVIKGLAARRSVRQRHHRSRRDSASSVSGSAFATTAARPARSVNPISTRRSSCCSCRRP